jgi:hypothetical protein
MFDSTQKRGALIEHLETALGLAHELNEPTTEYLIERAIDEARSHQIGPLGVRPSPSNKPPRR